MPFPRHFTMNIAYSGLIIIALGDEGMVGQWDGGINYGKIIQGMIS